MKSYPVYRAVVITAALVLLWASVALAVLPSKPYTFTPNTLIQSSQVNVDFDTLYSAFATIDNTNIGAAGIYASQIIPVSQATATFGGSAQYVFPAAGISTALIQSLSTGQVVVQGINASDPFAVEDASSNLLFDVGSAGVYAYHNLTMESGTVVHYNGGSTNLCARFDASSDIVPASGDCLAGVTASAPLAASTGTTPNISLTGTVAQANGGTGATSVQGAGLAPVYNISGQILTSEHGVVVTGTSGSSQVACGSQTAYCATVTLSGSARFSTVNSTTPPSFDCGGPQALWNHTSGYWYTITASTAIPSISVADSTTPIATLYVDTNGAGANTPIRITCWGS